MLEVSTVVKRLDSDRRVVYALIASGDLEAVNIGRPGARRPTWRIPEASLLALLQRRKFQPARGIVTRGS